MTSANQSGHATKHYASGFMVSAINATSGDAEFSGLNISHHNDPTRLYVIGDIHGRADLVDQIAAKIHDDLDRRPKSDCLTLTLGDYIDRGSDARGVLERLARNPFPTRYIALKGNHEVLLEAFLRDQGGAAEWLRLGGLETLRSYGVPTDGLIRGKGYQEAANVLRSAVPQDHLRFLSSLQPCVAFGDYFFCHAGARPNIPLAQQSIDDLLWIREEFLESDFVFEKRIVHGHTPRQWPEVRPNRINVDTAAFATGRLTCLVLELDSTEPRFIFTA